jgi:hypothetical protein
MTQQTIDEYRVIKKAEQLLLGFFYVAQMRFKSIKLE